MVKYIISASCFVTKFFITFFLCSTLDGIWHKFYEIVILNSVNGVYFFMYNSWDRQQSVTSQHQQSEDGLSIYFGQPHISASVSSKVVHLTEKQIWEIGFDAMRVESVNFKADWEMYVWNGEKYDLQLTKEQQTCINQTKLYKHYQLWLGGSGLFCSSNFQTFACYCFCAIEKRDKVASVTQEGSSMICFYL